MDTSDLSNNSETFHNRLMDAALEQAQKARDAGEVPIGAVVADETGKLMASAFNQTIQMADPTAHAEILAIRKAADRIQNYRLLNMSLYVTIEPCIMCMGAVIHARLTRVVFGTRDPKWGGAGSLYNFAADRRLNHEPEIISGVRENECRTIIVDFFTAKRLKNSR
ncbi:MAG: tRNA adenosine(34) deaminase TadA [Desulfobacterales bacterium]|nr:tRNA adenosine(34) deaminase TadA [Desulfobacterales bacterium]